MTEPAYARTLQKGISISSIITAFHCPRQYMFYTENKGKPAFRYSICKLVSCAEKNADEEGIWSTVCMIHPDISEEYRTFLHDCLNALRDAPVRPWTETDIPVRSHSAGIHGLLDKYDASSGAYTITRCTTAPKNGCWPEDAVRAAALLLCIEETSAKKPTGLSIEYIPSGIIRWYEPTPKDRRKVFHLVRQIREIDKGGIPCKPMNPPCARCRFTGRCESGAPRRLSFLFKKGE